MKCPRCQQDNPAHARFCLGCGARLGPACSSCGTELPAGARFCLQCGHAVVGSAGPPPRASAPETYTPKHLVERILSSRAALEGERKQVTVLFADLKGSMELLADRDPEEARQLLDPVIEHMMAAVHRYEGTVNQIMGDGIMALFGAPLAHEDHAVRACYAALRMQEAVRRYADDARRAHGVEVQIRVGLNSGEVVVRAIGSDLRMDYTAVGQTTHLAARMEQLALPGTIRLTGGTARLAEGYIRTRPLGPVPVKGLATPVDVHELVGALAIGSRLQAATARGLSRFVGRETEMRELGRAAEEARSGRGQLVAAVGEPGVGKSRLFHEFLRSPSAHGWRALESGSISYDRATPFLPLADLLRGYLGVTAQDDVRTARANVTGHVLALDETLRDAIPAVLWLLDALGEDSGFLVFDPAERRRRALAAAKALLLRESRVQPLLIVFEDLHWVDAETQTFLDGFVESLPGARVLLMVSYRPEYLHAWGNKTFYRQLRIDALPAASAGDLLRGMLGGDPSVAPLATRLIERTEGTPLFLEESVRALVEAGALTGAHGAYRLTKGLDAVRLPATVQAILGARIDRLPPEDKRLLQAASVIGKDVPFALLDAVAELNEDALRHGLARLQAAELLHETQLFPELEYAFRHALTHEVAYGSLLAERRRSLHAAVVSAIERLYAGRLGEQVDRLAYHAERGELWEQAAVRLHQAGLRAVARSAYVEGIGTLMRALAALAHLPDDDSRVRAAIDIRIDLGPALIATRGGADPEVEASYQDASRLCERAGDPGRRFPVLWGLWFVNNIRGRHDRARPMGEGLLELARVSGDPEHLLEAHHALWPVLMETGELQVAEAHLRAGLALYDPDRHHDHAFRYGNHDPGVCARIYAARRLWLLGFPDQALAGVRDGARLARRLAHPYTTAFSLYHEALIHHWRGERREALERARTVDALCEEHRISTHFRIGAMLLHRLLSGAGESPDVLGERVARLGSGAAGRGVFLRSLLADVWAGEGQYARGLDALGEAIDLAGEGVERFWLAELHRRRGDLLLGRDATDGPEAEVAYRLALGVATQLGARSLGLRAAIALAQLLARQGRGDESRPLLAPLHAAFSEGHDTADLAAARALLG